MPDGPNEVIVLDCKENFELLAAVEVERSDLATIIFEEEIAGIAVGVFKPTRTGEMAGLRR